MSTWVSIPETMIKYWDGVGTGASYRGFFVLIDEIDDWCCENVVEISTVHERYSLTYRVEFETEEDALAFTMRWL